MTDITDKEASALVGVLSLAENHPLWTEKRGYTQKDKDIIYGKITTVRKFLKRNGIPTMHAALAEIELKHQLACNAHRVDANQPWRHP